MRSVQNNVGHGSTSNEKGMNPEEHGESRQSDGIFRRSFAPMRRKKQAVNTRHHLLKPSYLYTIYHPMISSNFLMSTNTEKRSVIGRKYHKRRNSVKSNFVTASSQMNKQYERDNNKGMKTRICVNLKSNSFDKGRNPECERRYKQKQNFSPKYSIKNNEENPVPSSQTSDFRINSEEQKPYNELMPFSPPRRKNKFPNVQYKKLLDDTSSANKNSNSESGEGIFKKFARTFDDIKNTVRFNITL